MGQKSVKSSVFSLLSRHYLECKLGLLPHSKPFKNLTRYFVRTCGYVLSYRNKKAANPKTNCFVNNDIFLA